VLADKGYPGAGAGVRTPYPRRAGAGGVHPATLGWNSYVNTERVPVERAIATLKVHWPALRRISHYAASACALGCHRRRRAGPHPHREGLPRKAQSPGNRFACTLRFSHQG
jgi:hypothetical protein